jgi:2-polyprenyl-3-methyl-5-hydroxy-6-metoxy-1,4-benzoquinol methylase
MQSPTAALEWASDVIEEAGIPAGRETNWALQRLYQSAWMVPALDALEWHQMAREDAGATSDHPDLQPYRLLDLGTGYGTFAVASHTLGAEVVGIDWHTPLPKLEAEGLSWRRQDIEAPEPLGGPYDCVAMLEVLEHLNCHPLPLLRRIRAALRPSGILLGSTPDPAVWQEQLPPVELADMPQWHSSADLADRHVRLYERGELEALLLEAGFSCVIIDRTGTPRYHWRAQ